MNYLKLTFLFRLWVTDKKLFTVVLLYIAGILFCIFNCNTFLFSNRCEEFPFLLYGMYSLKEEPRETYSHYIISIDGKILQGSPLSDSRYELVNSVIEHVEGMDIPLEEKQRKRDSVLRWLESYVPGENRIAVFRNTVAYNSAGEQEPLHTELLFTNDSTLR